MGFYAQPVQKFSSLISEQNILNEYSNWLPMLSFLQYSSPQQTARANGVGEKD